MSHTPTPWRWEYNAKHKSMQLVGGKPKFDLTIMDFERWGMQGSVVRLREPSEEGFNTMYRLCDRPDWIAPYEGREHHKDWFSNIIHPDMRRIVACVNACEGLSQDALDGGWTANGIRTYAKSLEQQRDQLLEALELAREEMRIANFNSAAERIDAAIEAAKGE